MAVLKTRLLIAFIMLLSVSQIFSQNIVISSNNGELEYMDGLPVLKAESYSCFNKNASDASWRIVISSLALSDGVWYRSLIFLCPILVALLLIWRIMIVK